MLPAPVSSRFDRSCQQSLKLLKLSFLMLLPGMLRVISQNRFCVVSVLLSKRPCGHNLASEPETAQSEAFGVVWAYTCRRPPNLVFWTHSGLKPNGATARRFERGFRSFEIKMGERADVEAVCVQVTADLDNK